MGEKKLFKIKEICEIYQIGRKVIDKAIHNGSLKSYKINDKERRLKISDVDNWINTLTYEPILDIRKIIRNV